MSEKRVSFLYKSLKKMLSWVYPKMELVGTENLPEEPCVIVANHAQMNGPIACELNFPEKRYTWCAGEMMNWREVPAYAYRDFWSEKPKLLRPFYKLLSYLITPLAVPIFRNANTIPVYHDARAVTTFKESLHKLEEGDRLVIFPEHNVKYNHIVYEFQEKFVDLAKMFYKRTKKELSFVPMYIAPKLRKLVLGKPIVFRALALIAEERRRICGYLMYEITRLACALPLHTVIPYRNIPKKDYPKNQIEEKQEL